MSLDEFNEKLEKFIQELSDSDIYKKYIEADKAIYEDKKAIELSVSKDNLERELEYLYSGESNEALKEEKMKELAGIQKELYALDSVKNYMKYRTELKEILGILEQGILRSVK